MACVTVTSLMRTLELEFVQPQPRPIVQDSELISGENKELIKSLREKLQLLMEQIDDKRMDGTEAIKRLESKLRDVASTVEDEIEFLIVDLYEEKTHKVQPCLKLHHILRQAIEDIDHIKEEIEKVLKNESEHVIDMQRKKGKATLDVISSQHASPSEEIMVGKTNEFLTIKEMLIEHTSKNREVVSIKGMGGIGKTTLARRVYEDPSVVSHFDKRGWVVASQHHNKREMLIGLSTSIMNLDGAANCTDEDLAENLYRGLKGQRYLVVIDDIWSTEALDAIKRFLPDDSNRSRVLLTTRLEEVANSNKDFSHQMHFLDQSESWNLFYKKACGSRGYEFETIGRPIVEKCKGLPLSIVVVAGLFSKLNTLAEWKIIAGTLHSNASATIDDECSRILSLSYNHLPYKLKACFLYLSVFQEDEEIKAKDLARLWFAEGLVEALENESFDAVAKRYIQELMDRNLILVRRRSGVVVKEIGMHDLLHAFCVKEAQNERLLNVINDNGSDFPREGFRWVSIQSPNFDGRTSPFSSKYCRSIFHTCQYVSLTPLNLQNFNILRVLHAPFHSFVGEIMRPIHLRYYHSSSLDFNLEPFITWNLHIIRSFPASFTIPLLDFPHLCYVYSEFKFWTSPPEFVHQNVQSIIRTRSSCCTKVLFTKIPYIRKIGIDLKGRDAVDCIGNLSYLQQLESLKIYFRYGCHGINNQISLLKNLKKLTFLQAGFLQFVTGGFSWEEINVFSMLPRLEVLKLLDDSCKGRKWKLREDETFCQLTCLKFYALDIEDLEVTGDHFPKLECLLLDNCYNLKEIPSSFADISTLKLIELRQCLPSAVTSAKQIQEEQRDQGNTNMTVVEEYTRRVVRQQHWDSSTEAEEEETEAEEEELEDED